MLATACSSPTEVSAADRAKVFGEVTNAVTSFVDEAQLDGATLIIVERDEGVIYEEYFGAFDAERVSLIASASKMISAGVLLRLQEQQLLNIEAPIEQVVGWEGNNPDITTAQLLSNSSGLVGIAPDLYYAPYACQWESPGTLQACGETIFTTTDDDAAQTEPDTGFRYGGGQWQVAGAVAETVAGESWNELVRKTYAACDVSSLGYISLGSLLDGSFVYPTAFGGDPTSVAPSDNPNIEGGAYIAAPDYAKLLLMHLRGGVCGDTQVFSQESLDTMHADRVAAAYDQPGDTGYGMGWWMDRSTGRISDGGAWGTIPWLDLDDGYGVVLVLEDSGANGQTLRAEIEGLIARAVVGE